MSTWILLGGLTRGSAHWAGFPPLLKEQFGAALDLPGNRSFYPLTSPARIETMTQWCREHPRSRRIGPPYHVLAVSMGAMVAVDWAAREPDALAGCVLINTSMRAFSP